jgi:hypothetical protein
MEIITLSKLSHTWLIDIDGTILKHNGYKENSFNDSLLPHSKKFINNLPKIDFVILLTSRSLEYKVLTEKFLKSKGVRFDLVIYGLPYGERILINDEKPSGLKTAHALNFKRDNGINIKLLISKFL